MSIVEVKNLSFIYNEKTPFAKQALCDINLTIDEGEMVAIVGHTGSGKSTFVQHLNGLIRVQKGSVSVCGTDLVAKKVDWKALRGNVGMVFQYPEYQLFADTVKKDVEFGPKNIGMDAQAAEEAARQALCTVGLDYATISAKSPFELSGGERRRVALAGVLAMNPKVLILDEPTAGLDPRGKGEILSLVKQLNKNKGVTVLMVSHDMNEVYENTKRILLFSEGKIVADCSTQQLFERSKEIEQADLALPTVAYIKNYLKEHKNIFLKGMTVEEVAQELLQVNGRSKI